MAEVKSHLDKAFNYLNQISVKGDSVDLLALAKQELRTAFSELQKDHEYKIQNEKEV